MAEFKTKVLILGSGPAGYTAGIYTSRAGLNPIIVSGSEIGGQLTLSEEVENYPGFASSMRGQDLMDTIKQQTLNLGVKIITDKIVEIDFNKYPFECSSENNNIFYAQCIIVATGASAKWLEIESEKQFRGFGVSVCATCDGFFYRGKDVAVVGGGNTAAEEALYLTNFAKSVTIIHRRTELRTDEILQQKLKKHPKINIKYDVVVEKVIGQENPASVTGIVLKNVKTDKTEELKIEGLFVAIGHRPNTEIFRNQLELDKNGYIITKPNSCSTNIKGVFAAGDVKDPEYRQAIIAAGSGAMAAIEATRWLGR